MRYIAALDVGTTTVRCYIIDENLVTVAGATEKVRSLHLHDNLFTIINNSTCSSN